MLKGDNKTLKYNHGEKSMKVAFIISADLECLLEKMSTYINPESLSHYDPEKSLTTKINEHKPSGYSLFTHCSFDATKNKLDCYKGKDCLKNFCLDLRKYAAKIINYEKKRNDTINKSRK